MELPQKINLQILAGTVQETLFLPLLARARCAEKYPELFHDPESAAIANVLELDQNSSLYKMADSACALYALRQDMLVFAARRYLKKYPEAVIVNLGCGLDTSFSKADNGRCRWINLDLPETAALREQLLPNKERESVLAWNAADISWMEQADGSRGLFVVSGGALYYFQPEQVKKIFCALAECFPGGGICFDCQNKKAVRQARKVVERTGNTGVKMHFAVEDAEMMFRSWSKRFEKIETISRLPQRYLSRDFLPLRTRLTLRHRFMSGMMKFVEIRFRE